MKILVRQVASMEQVSAENAFGEVELRVVSVQIEIEDLTSRSMYRIKTRGPSIKPWRENH